MWQCPNCGEQIDDAFDACWKCGAAQDGTPAAVFHAEPSDPAVPDLGSDPETPAETAEDAEAARAMRERIVELCSAADMAEADGVCELLEEEAGIRARVVGGFLGAAAGCLPLGEATAPRVWVRESDAAHAREIIEQWRRRQTTEPVEFPESDEWPDVESAVDPDESPLPSDVRLRFLSQGFFIAGMVCVALGSIWAWQERVKVSTYSAATIACEVGTPSGHRRIAYISRDPNLPLQPSAPAWYFYDSSATAHYAYVVDGKHYPANLTYNVIEKLPSRTAIHYDPRHPAEHVVGEITPPWVPLLLAFAVGSFLCFVGHQFR